MIEPIKEDEVDLYELNRQMDKIKSKVFMGENSAFLGSLMCSLNFIWTESLSTCATDGVNLYFNPKFFMSIHEDTRKFALLHELWHVARLHCIRGVNLDQQVFNWACDIRINNDLHKEGCRWPDFTPWFEPSYGDAVEEDIYDDLMKNRLQPPPSPWGDDGDMIPMTDDKKVQVINSVVKAIQQAKLAGGAGTLPGDIEATLDKFLAPVVPWQSLLQRFFSELLTEDYSWKKPNRRYTDMYLPSRYMDDGKLAHLAYYLDVSGSISDSDIIRFNSEVKYIKETYNPEKISMIQFDDGIRKIDILEEHDDFNELKVVGRGGTMWAPVKDHIEKTKPTAAIIFTDLGFFDPITELSFDIPIIWVGVHTYSYSPPFGEFIAIKD